VLSLLNFDLHNVFQEHNPGIKQDLPVHGIILTSVDAKNILKNVLVFK
jgi:hypothetical protein